MTEAGGGKRQTKTENKLLKAVDRQTSKGKLTTGVILKEMRCYVFSLVVKR